MSSIYETFNNASRFAEDINNNGITQKDVDTILAHEKLVLIYNLLSPKNRENKELSIAYIKGNGSDFKQVPKSIRGVFEIAVVAIEKEPSNYKLLPDETKHNRELAILAGKNCSILHRWLPDELMNDFEIGLAVYSKNNSANYCGSQLEKFIDQYPKPKKVKEALTLAVELTKQGFAIPHHEDVFEIKKKIDLAHDLEEKLSRQPPPRKSTKMKL